MKFMAIDLEMNQPSGTIIQVGVCVGDLETGAFVDSFSAFRRTDEPIAEYITKLTGITQDMVTVGDRLTPCLHLEDIYQEIVKLHTAHQCFRNPLTWGGGDSQELKEQLFLDQYGLDAGYVFGRRWLDVKTLFQARCFANGTKPQAGLAKALLRSGLRFQGRKHDALDDAVNTWKLFYKLVKG